jgi:hypothetical protein
MARMMNALQLALGSVGSGIQGYAQARAQREEQERKQAEAEQEQSRVAAAFERQSRMDTMAMEDREQAKQDRLQAQRAALLKGGYVPKGLDMPGATPRTPVSTEMVGDQEYNLYSTPRQMALQSAMEEAELKKKFAPKEQMTPYQAEMIRQRELDRQARGRTSAGDVSDKTTKAGIDKAIAGAGKIVAASRNEERMAETQLAALDRNRPDPYKLELSGQTDEQIAAAEAAWQKKVAAAEKRLEAAQSKTSRLSPTYEGSLVSRDTTGYGETFNPPAPAVPARQPTYNTKEATLGSQAQRKIDEIQSSDLTDEEKQQKVQQVNAILSREIMKARGQG